MTSRFPSRPGKAPQPSTGSRALPRGCRLEGPFPIGIVGGHLGLRRVDGALDVPDREIVIASCARMAVNCCPIPDRESILGQFVRDRRLANRLKQRDLAELAGVGVRLVSELERDKPTLRMDAVNRVLAVFGKRLGAVDLPREDAS